MIELKCLTCNSSFFVKKYRKDTAKYCSRKCKPCEVAGKNKQNKVSLICQWCANGYLRLPKEVDRSKYCSRLCHNKAINIYRGKFGKESPFYSTGITFYRKLAFDNFPNKCNQCSSLKNLMVHHKDENRKNNDLSNLEILCRSCHQIHHKVINNIPSNLGKRKIKLSICINCKKEYIRFNGHINQKYCNRKCYFSHRYTSISF